MLCTSFQAKTMIFYFRKNCWSVQACGVFVQYWTEFFFSSKSLYFLYWGLLNMLCKSFHEKTLKFYFGQNSCPLAFSSKIKPSFVLFFLIFNFFTTKSLCYLYQGLPKMQSRSFWAKTQTSYFEQNSWPRHICTKLNRVFLSPQNIFAICIFDLKIFCVKFFKKNRQYFILSKILVLYGLRAFLSKVKTIFFFFFFLSCKISFLFVSRDIYICPSDVFIQY